MTSWSQRVPPFMRGFPRCASGGLDAADAAKARSLRDKGVTATDIAKMLAVSRATLYRYLADGVQLSA